MPPAAASYTSLYRRILGPSFDTLPSVLKCFHEQPNATAHGRFEIIRGRGMLRNLLATLAGFPRAGSDVPVVLRVTAEGDRERWSRDFGGHRLETVQWDREGALIEAAGPVRFAFDVTADDTSMRFTIRRAWFLGIPIPRPLAPRVSAVVTANADGWSVDVQVMAPVVGLLVRYAGILTSDAEPHQEGNESTIKGPTTCKQ